MEPWALKSVNGGVFIVRYGFRVFVFVLVSCGKQVLITPMMIYGVSCLAM